MTDKNQNKHNVEVISAYSSAGDGVVNEDYFGWTNRAAWVLDGATGVTDDKLPYPSDAYWFVRTFSRHLEYQLLTRPDATTLDIMNKAIFATREHYFKDRKIKDLENETVPSAAFVMVRKMDNGLEIASLGDCKALYIGGSGALEYFYDPTLKPFEDRTLTALQALRKDNPDLPQKEIIEQLKPTIQGNRRFMNKPDGYSILSLTDIDETALKIKNIPPVEGRPVALMSDGFLRYTEVLEQGNYEDLYQRATGEPLAHIMAEIRAKEHADPECQRYIRVKRSDDATCLTVRFS